MCEHNDIVNCVDLHTMKLNIVVSNILWLNCAQIGDSIAMWLLHGDNQRVR